MNLSELGVRVVYRNRKMEPTYSCVYSLAEYTDMLRADLLKLVTDVENLCYAANGNKPKEDWSDETFDGFSRIKHKLLDKAGDIGRIPENMTVRESMSTYVARVLNEGEISHGEGRLGQD